MKRNFSLILAATLVFTSCSFLSGEEYNGTCKEPSNRQELKEQVMADVEVDLVVSGFQENIWSLVIKEANIQDLNITTQLEAEIEFEEQVDEVLKKYLDNF